MSIYGDNDRPETLLDKIEAALALVSAICLVPILWLAVKVFA